MKLVKYPRTPHAFWSQSVTDDDKIQKDYSIFDGEIVMTEKMDGENTTMYRDHFHARSLDSQSHWTQDWCRAFHASIKNDIPNYLRLCGENLFATHSINYDNLKSYFYLFGIWTDNNECLSWDETLEWAELLGLTVVPQIYRGIWGSKGAQSIHMLWERNYIDADPAIQSEGYVIRSTASFKYDDFGNKTMKYVRKNHVTTDSHWKSGKIEQNKLK